MQISDQQNNYTPNYNYPTQPQPPQPPGQAYQYYPNQFIPAQQIVGGFQPQQAAGSPLGYQPLKLPRTADGMRFPVDIECPYCNKNARTRIVYQAGGHACCLGCVLLFIFPICFCLPCLMDDQKDVVHYCTQCNKQVGFQKKKACD